MNIRKAVDYSTMFATLESVMKADLPQMELYCEIGKAVCAHSDCLLYTSPSPRDA